MDRRRESIGSVSIDMLVLMREQLTIKRFLEGAWCPTRGSRFESRRAAVVVYRGRVSFPLDLHDQMPMSGCQSHWPGKATDGSGEAWQSLPSPAS